ncbi:MAG: hypothetical protein KKH92_00405 [Firmicutes bacterium]|nr:hypothetical protein [Bacillota bacterium]
MEYKLIESIVLNGPMMIRMEGNHIIINAYQHETRIEYSPKDQPDPIEGITGHRKGSQAFSITSDIYDCLNLNFKEKNLDSNTMRDIFTALFESSIQFIAKVSSEENTSVLIQNSFDERNMYFLSTIGLLDDARIIFAEIKPSTKKKSKVKNDA